MQEGGILGIVEGIAIEEFWEFVVEKEKNRRLKDKIMEIGARSWLYFVRVLISFGRNEHLTQ